MQSQPSNPVRTFPQTILSIAQVEKRVGLARETFQRMELRGEFPERLLLSPRRIGWLASEIEGWIVERARQRDEAVKRPPVQRRPPPFDDELDDRLAELRRLDTS
jgi:predicted DNA-binding transcriptional regulator AlpA